MSKKSIISIVVIIIILIIATFIASIKEGKNGEDTLREQVMEEETNRPEITINTKHQYIDGQHAFVGTLELPSPCHSFNAEITPGTSPVEINLTVTDPADDESCIQVTENKDFKVVHEGEENQIFVIKLNGEIVNMNLFEVSPEDDIDTIELFFKG